MNPTNPLRFAVIGAGMIGQLHAKTISEMEGAELVAVCSRDLSRAKAYANTYGGEPVIDYESIVNRKDVDAVTICTASGEHAAQGIPAAESGKHVVVEKPIDITLDRADALIDACRANGVKLATIFQLRFLDASEEVKAALEHGVIGKLVQADCYMKFYRPQEYYDTSRWKGTQALDGGGALINQGIHGLDLLLHLAGDVASVKAYTGALAHENIEVEDTCAAVLKYRSGALGVVQATTSIHPDFQQRIELHGTEGTIVLEGTEDTWISHWETFNETRTCEAPDPVDHSGGAAAVLHGGEGHQRQFADFVDAVRNNREPAINGSEGRRSLSVVRAIYDSAKSGAETSPC